MNLPSWLFLVFRFDFFWRSTRHVRRNVKVHPQDSINFATVRFLWHFSCFNFLKNYKKYLTSSNLCWEALSMKNEYLYVVAWSLSMNTSQHEKYHIEERSLIHQKGYLYYWPASHKIEMPTFFLCFSFIVLLIGYYYRLYEEVYKDL